MRVADFHFDLPEELIAQTPPPARGDSRMLRLDRASGHVIDDHFRNLPEILRPGDLLILNDSRVLPARLYATRAGLSTQHKSPRPSGLIEVLLTERVDEGEAAGENLWRALVRPARKVQPGETLLFAHPSSPHIPLITAEVLATGDHGERTLRFSPSPDFHAILERIGHLPLPPYIHRDPASPDTREDIDRYQTVYASPAGSPGHRSAAAPTAGLHFTPEVLDRLRQNGVEVQYLTLHVGLGTFQPVRVDRTEDIRLHAEHYTLPEPAAAALNRALQAGRRIIAAGTTTTRTLEHVALTAEISGDALIRPHSGTTSIFISPGHRFRLVSGLLTNFHLPQSTLLMLVSAFAGTGPVLSAYAHAVQQRYRFFSYGDCMLIL